MLIEAALTRSRYNMKSEILAYEPLNLQHEGTHTVLVVMYRGPKAPCNFKCQFCFFHALPYNGPITLEQCNKELETCDAVLVGGLEATQYEETTTAMLREARRLGKACRLDTNGTNPDYLAYLFDEGLLDYVAMDVKAPPAKYPLVTGVKADTKAVGRSIELVKARAPMYKFRTTLVKPLLNIDDILAITDWIGNAKWYEVHDYWEQKNVRAGKGVLSAFSDEEKEKLLEYLQKNRVPIEDPTGKVNCYRNKKFDDVVPRRGRSAVGL